VLWFKEKCSRDITVYRDFTLGQKKQNKFCYWIFILDLNGELAFRYAYGMTYSINFMGYKFLENGKLFVYIT
jgi:hypothetical protein